MSVFVSIEMYDGRPVVKVKGCEVKDKRFSLTLRGCLGAGAYLFSFGADGWSYSSSVDFPEEYKGGCDFDVRDLLERGFKDAEKAKLELIGLILAHCGREGFQGTLSKKQKVLFMRLVEEHRIEG